MDPILDLIINRFQTKKGSYLELLGSNPLGKWVIGGPITSLIDSIPCAAFTLNVKFAMTDNNNNNKCNAGMEPISRKEGHCVH